MAEKEELEKGKSEAKAKISELEKQYSSGSLLDEEYEDLRKPFDDKIEKIGQCPNLEYLMKN